MACVICHKAACIGVAALVRAVMVHNLFIFSFFSAIPSGLCSSAGWHHLIRSTDMYIINKYIWYSTLYMHAEYIYINTFF